MKNPQDTLARRTIRGGFWVFALRIAQRFFDLVRLVILARILAPSDFGLMGIALLVMMTIETFSLTGFQQALIQKKGNIEGYLDTTWTVLILRGFLLFIILYFIAPYVSVFFETAAATSIIRVIALSALFQAFANIGVVYFQKELEFEKQFIYQFSGTLADFVVAISLAFMLRSVWALVFGLLAGNLVRCVASYIVHPARPRLDFELTKVKELFGFGKWILGSSILILLITHGDDIFVAKLLGAAALGFYQMAYRISNMTATEITHVISQVAFPAYSKLQENMSKLREAYLKVLQITTFLSIPLSGMIFALAPDFTKIFLGEKWMPMVPAMQVLALAGSLRAVAATAGCVFTAVGKPKIDTKLQVVRLFLMATLIYPFAVKWGILGVSIAILLSVLVSSIGFNRQAIRITTCEVKEFGRIILFPSIGGVAVISIIMGLKAIMSIGLWEFLILVCMGISGHLFVIYLSDRFFGYNIEALIKESFRSLRRV
ncbi:MAG: lipopolysaccharide biosynthesis protein [Candidatus Zixiibacteriota bacterium]|nr:MAG: lipopolysaccharide biosynthesis protein [candidate division Zixibacteria bacterium]